MRNLKIGVFAFTKASWLTPKIEKIVETTVGNLRTLPDTEILFDGLVCDEASSIRQAEAFMAARVDAVTSATYSSKAVIANVRAALAKAAGQPAPEPEAAAEVSADRSRGHRHGGRHGGPHGPPPSSTDLAISALGPDAAAAIAAQVPSIPEEK